MWLNSFLIIAMNLICYIIAVHCRIISKQVKRPVKVVLFLNLLSVLCRLLEVQLLIMIISKPIYLVSERSIIKTFMVIVNNKTMLCVEFLFQKKKAKFSYQYYSIFVLTYRVGCFYITNL